MAGVRDTPIGFADEDIDDGVCDNGRRHLAIRNFEKLKEVLGERGDC